MKTTAKLFELTQLAEASYANFYKVENRVNELQIGDDGKSLLYVSQANELDSHWEVFTKQQETSSGFFAALFQRVGDYPNSGFHTEEYVYAIRGISKNIGIW